MQGESKEPDPATRWTWMDWVSKPNDWRDPSEGSESFFVQVPANE